MNLGGIVQFHEKGDAGGGNRPDRERTPNYKILVAIDVCVCTLEIKLRASLPVRVLSTLHH